MSYPVVNNTAVPTAAAGNATSRDLGDPEGIKYWGTPEHSGWLFSQAKFLKDWRRRWFVLKEGFLFKFKDDAVTSDTKYRAFVDLRACLEISNPASDDNRKGPILQLIVKSYDKAGRDPKIETMNLVANSIPERDAWVQVLKMAKRSLTDEGSGPGVQWGVPSSADAHGIPKAAYPAVVHQPLPSPAAVTQYGEGIANELAKLRVDVDDIKSNVGAILENQRQRQEDDFDDDLGCYPDDCFSDYEEDDYSQEDVPTEALAAFDFFDSSPTNYGFKPVDECVGIKDVWPASEWHFYPDNHCGKRLRVLWRAGEQRVQSHGQSRSTGKDQWWAGVITLYNAAEGLHKVHYDDGEIECLDLQRCDHEMSIAFDVDFGPEDVGRRVDVFWAHEERHFLLSSQSGSQKRWCNKQEGVWYSGTITECRRTRFLPPKYPVNKFISDAAIIHYDDGDVELLDMQAAHFRYTSSPKGLEVGTRISLVRNGAWTEGKVTGASLDQTQPQVVEVTYVDPQGFGEEKNERVDLGSPAVFWRRGEQDSSTFVAPQPAPQPTLY